MTGVRVVLVTAPDEESGARLCRALVEERLAACGNVVPGIRSIYRWQGRIRDEGEALVVLKTTDSRADDLVRRIPDLHPYDVPEALVIDVERGHGPYLEWVTSVTNGS